ncbi:hypothetical protein ACEXQE_01565 [Herbiconiux sp. P17]|uniref:hypothetical protein n=1 Tax=Herbiconiux wuyangfengii TaxID=3342794 RepID=UPI0035B7118A
MYYSNWWGLSYAALMVVLIIGSIVLLVLLGRLMVVATQALKAYRRTQELRLELLLAGVDDDPLG